jgi:transcriptional regulator with XRE-family HTH domain
MNLASAVQEARKSVGWSVRALAERAELSPSTISAIENGNREMTVKTALQISKALNIDLEQLIGLARTLASQRTKKDKIEIKMRKIALQLVNSSVQEVEDITEEAH